jgi:hypothetical protein
METIFSADGSLYHAWQADLLESTHNSVGQSGKLIRLLSGDGDAPAFAGTTFQVSPASPHPITGDKYLPYNKPAAILAWMERGACKDETLLLIDPDFVFLAPFELPAVAGRPIAHPARYLDPWRHAELVRRHGHEPEDVQGIGVPILVHRDDLAALAPAWLARTEEIRANPASCSSAGWVAEMWAYALAAADLSLPHLVWPLAHVLSDDSIELPLLHYCDRIQVVGSPWTWDKRDHRHWSSVIEPPIEAPLATATFIEVLNDYLSNKHDQLGVTSRIRV